MAWTSAYYAYMRAYSNGLSEYVVYEPTFPTLKSGVCSEDLLYLWHRYIAGVLRQQ